MVWYSRSRSIALLASLLSGEDPFSDAVRVFTSLVVPVDVFEDFADLDALVAELTWVLLVLPALDVVCAKFPDAWAQTSRN